MIDRLWLRSIAPAVLASALFAAPAFAQSVTLTDRAGKTVQLAAPAARVVAIPVPMTSVIIALDGGIGRIAAMHPEAKLAIDFGILGEFYPDARKIPANILAGGKIRGTVPDAAALKALNPDLVIQWEHAGNDGIGPLTDAGLPTAIIRFGTDDNFRENLKLVGKAIGKEDRVDMLLKWRDDTSAVIAKGLEGVTEAEKPKVAYFFYGVKELFTEGKGTFADWQINHVGGINAAAGIDDWGEVTDEQVAEWNPDVILLGTFEPDLALERVKIDPELSKTNAVKNNRVYKMPLGGYRWESASHESPLTWMWLANILYPDRFHFDIRAAVNEWYPKLYGKAPTAEQFDRMLHMQMNGGSANYAQFAAK